MAKLITARRSAFVFAFIDLFIDDSWGCRMFIAKAQDELKALQLCQSKVKAKKLPMEVIDAEYQWCALIFALCRSR
jgi:hypothetical protein